MNQIYESEDLNEYEKELLVKLQKVKAMKQLMMQQIQIQRLENPLKRLHFEQVSDGVDVFNMGNLNGLALRKGPIIQLLGASDKLQDLHDVHRVYVPHLMGQNPKYLRYLQGIGSQQVSLNELQLVDLQELELGNLHGRGSKLFSNLVKQAQKTLTPMIQDGIQKGAIFIQDQIKKQAPIIQQKLNEHIPKLADSIKSQIPTMGQQLQGIAKQIDSKLNNQKLLASAVGFVAMQQNNQQNLGQQQQVQQIPQTQFQLFIQEADSQQKQILAFQQIPTIRDLKNQIDIFIKYQHTLVKNGIIIPVQYDQVRLIDLGINNNDTIQVIKQMEQLENKNYSQYFYQ